jgi:epoxyqueuosine reductase
MPRHGLDQAALIELFDWDEETFLKKTEGSAIRRIGFERWQRNIAIALGNGKSTDEAITLLKSKRETCSVLVAEHIDWALEQLS